MFPEEYRDVGFDINAAGQIYKQVNIFLYLERRIQNTPRLSVGGSHFEHNGLGVP